MPTAGVPANGNGNSSTFHVYSTTTTNHYQLLRCRPTLVELSDCSTFLPLLVELSFHGISQGPDGIHLLQELGPLVVAHVDSLVGPVPLAIFVEVELANLDKDVDRVAWREEFHHSKTADIIREPVVARTDLLKLSELMRIQKDLGKISTRSQNDSTVVDSKRICWPAWLLLRLLLEQLRPGSARCERCLLLLLQLGGSLALLSGSLLQELGIVVVLVWSTLFLNRRLGDW